MEKYLNKIILGDCLDVMKGMPDKSVDMILCDLPYGTTACKWDVVIPFDKLWEQYNRIIKDNGAIVLFGQEPFSSLLRISNIKNYKYDWVWEKQKASNFMGMKHQPAKYHELISVFNKHNYYPIMWESENKDKRKIVNNPKTNKDCHLGNIIRIRNEDNGLRYPKSIIKINKSINKNIHPTQKPVKLCEYLIKTYTNENEIVLDNCIGSGTTAIAAIRAGRQFIGIEKDPEYHRLATERVEKEKLNLFNTEF